LVASHKSGNALGGSIFLLSVCCLLLKMRC